MNAFTQLLVLALLSAAEPVPVEKVVPDVMPGDVEMAVIPCPKRERMSDRMIVVGRFVVCGRHWEDLRAGREHLVEALGGDDKPQVCADLEAAARSGADTVVVADDPRQSPALQALVQAGPFSFADLAAQPNADQGYLLSVRHDPAAKRNLVVIASSSSQGAFYAVQTLRQISFTRDGRGHVRMGDILDWPTFPARGTKRTVGTWEYALKSNFHYSSVPNMQTVRAHFADWWMPLFLPVVGKATDASPQGVQRAVDWIKQSHGHGARDYVIHLDDQTMDMTPETAQAFQGNYHAAIAHLVRECYKAMKALDPKATLYFMPQPYYTVSDYEDYAKGMWQAGGFPEDVAIHLCGPQVTSRAMPPSDIAAYAKAFRSRVRGVIYDNHLRDLDFGPISARPAALAQVIIGISPERGSAPTRATRLDWAWNPESYSPERSLMLACREFAGLDNWKKVHEMVATLEFALPGPAYLPREQALAAFERSVDRAAELLKQVEALPDGGMAGRLRPEDPTGGVEHPALGLVDDVILLDRALPLDQIARLAEGGAKAFYDALPEGAPADEADLEKANVVAAWLFDEDILTHAKDLTPRGNDAEVRGKVQQAEGKFGRAVRFAGRGGHLQVPHKPGQSLARFTAAAWVKLRRGNGSHQVILHKKNEKGERNYSLIVETASGQAYADIFPVDGPSSQTKVLDDQWHHLAATCDGRQTCFYVDGKVEATRPATKPLATGVGPICLGAIGAAPRPSGYAGNLIQQFPAGLKLLTETRRQLIRQHGFKETTAAAAASAPKIDAVLDDPVWRDAAEASPFVISGLGQSVEKPRDTSFRCAYDRENLYVALRMGLTAPLDPESDLAKRAQAGEDMPGTWQLGEQPAIAIMLDPRHSHESTYEFDLDAFGHRCDGRYEVRLADEPQGLAFNSGWKSAVRIEKDAWFAEVAIPLKSLGVTEAKPGMVMGLQVWRTDKGIRPNLWSYMPRWWGAQEPSQSGHLMLR